MGSRLALLMLPAMMIAMPAWARDAGGRTDGSCPALGRPVVAIQATSYYESSDASRSAINADKQKENVALTQPVNDFLDALSNLSDQYVLTGSRRAKACADDIFYRWASSGALMDVQQGPQSRYVQQWATSTLGLARMKLGKLASPQRDAVVRRWLQAMAGSVNGFQQGDGGSKRNNHYYWAMLGIGAIGLSTGDRALWDRSESMYRVALGDIGADGTLPAELKRGQRAAHYHAFAAQPLAIHSLLRSECARGGRGGDQQLGRLIGVVRGEVAGRGVIAKDTGVKQTRVSTQPWLSLYDAVERDRPAQAGARTSTKLAGRMDTLAATIEAGCQVPR